ncbi:MAG: T9SS type B sorting domain-containing protein [Pricia sp.]
MKKLIIWVSYLGCTCFLVAQSIVINPQDKEESQMEFGQLTQALFSSECLATLGESSSLRRPEQYAYFEQGESDFPLARGLVLTTGSAAFLAGPNLSVDQSTAEPILSGGYLVIQEILDVRSGTTANTQDDLSTRFEFIPETDRISLRYIFASEAYGDPRNIECQSGQIDLQDGFAIIIKGPGIVPDRYDDDGDPTTPAIEFLHGGKNIALLADNVTEVGMHSVHNNSACTNEVKNDLFVEVKPGVGSIALNGMTVPLTAASDVLPGERYSIELVIANRGDYTLDSALFVEAFEEVPEPQLEDSYTICRDNQGIASEPLQMVDTGINDLGYSFQWFLDGSPIKNEDGPSLLVRTDGPHSVQITGPSGCSKEYPFVVSSSSTPTAILYTLSGKVFTDAQDLQINASGDGEYRYQLNGLEPQESPIFSDVSPGNYEITVLDSRGCGSKTIEVIIMDYPKFFTPNSDGSNDFWNINFSDLCRSGKVSIFDRFGTLITVITSQQIGWDGTFNGRPMPSSDYWFLLQLDDGSMFKNHFTLKR